MPVRINCPDCETPNTVADDKRGRKVRCRECETSFLVPAEKRRRADDDDAIQAGPQEKAFARSRRQDSDDVDEDDDPRPMRKRLRRPAPKASGSSAMLLVIGGVVAVLLLCLVGAGGIAGLFYFRAKPVAAAQPPAKAIVEPGRHVEPGGGFSYLPPPGWQTRPFPGSKFNIAAGMPANGFAPNINFVEERFNGTLDAYVRGNITSLQGAMKNFRIVRQDAFQTTAGLPGARLICENEQNGLRLRQTFYFFGKGNTKFVVACTTLADGGAALDVTFETSMKTFRFD